MLCPWRRQYEHLIFSPYSYNITRPARLSRLSGYDLCQRMSRAHRRVVDWMIARDDGEHIKPLSAQVILSLRKSHTFVVRASKSERMTKLTILARYYDYGPPHFFSFFLILRGCGSFSTLSVFLGTNTTGATGVTFICQPSSFSSLVWALGISLHNNRFVLSQMARHELFWNLSPQNGSYYHNPGWSRRDW